MEFVVKLLCTHAAGVGIGAEPLLVDTVNQIVVVILREPELGAQKHIQPHFVAPFLGSMVTREVVIHHFVPVVLCINAGEILGMQVVSDHQAGESVAHIAVHHIGGKQMTALAGLRRMGVGIIQVTVHFSSPLSGTRPFAGHPVISI